MPPSLLIIVPCFNEELALPSTIKVLLGEIKELINLGLISNNNSGICFVDDGSKDNSWNIIKSYSDENKKIKGIKLTRNKGHQAALLAGLLYAKEIVDLTITIDADLQDDPKVLKKMIKFYMQGYDIVYGVRANRSSDSFNKRLFANLFYKLMIFLGVDIIKNHSDFRLISSRALFDLSEYKESSLFLRGLIPLLGYKSAKVYYPRKSRNQGEAKYTSKKLLTLAIDGVLSFTFKPLRYITYLGLISSMVSLLLMIIAIVQFSMGGVVRGWTSLFVIVSLLGSLQLLSLGLIGEYLGRIYKEVKGRPNYHIQEYIGFND